MESFKEANTGEQVVMTASSEENSQIERNTTDSDAPIHLSIMQNESLQCSLQSSLQNQCLPLDTSRDCYLQCSDESTDMLTGNTREGSTHVEGRFQGSPTHALHHECQESKNSHCLNVSNDGQRRAILSNKDSAFPLNAKNSSSDGPDRDSNHSSPAKETIENTQFSQQINNPAILNQKCQICSRYGSPKNAVRIVPLHELEILRSCEVHDNRLGVYVKPYHTGTERSPSEIIRQCRACRRLFLRLAKDGKRRRNLENLNKPIPGSLRKSIERLTRLFNRYLHGSSKTQPTKTPKVCFLENKTIVSCSHNLDSIYHPTRLASLDQSLLDSWASQLTAMLQIERKDALEIARRCSELRLCAVHTGYMKRALTSVRSELKRCSVCCVLPDGCAGSTVTPFLWNRIAENEENICILEDTLNGSKYKDVSPSAIQYLCGKCRRWLLRGINVRKNVPKQGGFPQSYDYGRTPAAIRRAIQYVRNRIRDSNCVIIRAKHVIQEYYKFVKETGEHMYAYRSERTILQYMQPSLSDGDIFLRTASRKEGSFFCSLSKFDELSKEAGHDDFQFPHPSILRELLLPLRKYISSRQEDLLHGNWEIHDFIQRCPELVWRFQVLFVNNPSKLLMRRGRAEARIHGTNFSDEWPLNPKRCPSDITTRAPYEFSFALQVYHFIEKSILIQSSGKVRGPITILLSLCGLPNTTVSFLGILNKLACTVSYTKLSEWRGDAVQRRRERGPFNELVSNAFVSIAVDNINVRASHSLSIHGSSNHGFDGLAVQAVNSNPNFNVNSYLNDLSEGEKAPRYFEFTSRLDYVNSRFPKSNEDPDILGYRYYCIGTAIANAAQLACADSEHQKSFRRALMEGLGGRSGGKANVEYVDIRRCSATDIFEIERILGMVEEKFNPPSSKKVVLVAVVGDQPIFKMVFRLWVEAYVKKTRRALWLIPIPGGFHVDKQGLIPTVKQYLWGCGIDQLLRFSGLSSKNQDNFIQLPHFRKNRRFLSQCTCAMLLRLRKSLAEMNPGLSVQLQTHVDRINQWKGLSTSEQERIAFEDNYSQKSFAQLPENCKLVLSRTLHPSVIVLGKLISDEVESISVDSKNMKVFAEIQLFNVLIPWTGYNITLRKGQTSIVEKFYDTFIGFLHGTKKQFYQENLLFWRVERDCISKAAHNILFEFGHTVANQNRHSTNTNLALDEMMESGIIRDTKKWRTSDEKCLTESPQLTMMVAKASEAAESQLQASYRQHSVKEDTGVPHSNRRYYRKVDREKKTAFNVLEMLRFLNERKYLGIEHVRSAALLNPLPEPPIRITDNEFIEQFIQADTRGRFAASLHLGTKLYPIFKNCGITEEERKAYFGGKPISQIVDRWNRDWLVKSVLDADPNRNAVEASQRRDREESMKLLRYSKRRRERVQVVLSRISKVFYECTKSGISHRKRLLDVQKLLDEIHQVAHILSPKAFAYRKAVYFDEPLYSQNTFYADLQSTLKSANLMQEKDSFYFESSFAPLRIGINVVHVDVQRDAQRQPSLRVLNRTIEEATDDKADRFVRPLVSSPQLAGVRDLHFHTNFPKLKNFFPPYNVVQSPPRRYKYLTAVTDSEQGENPQTVGMNSQFECTWSTIFEDERNKYFLTALHAVKCSKAAILITSQCNEFNQTTNRGRFPEMRPALTTFFHGVAVVYEKRAMRCCLESLSIERFQDSVLLRVTKKKEGPNIPSGQSTPPENGAEGESLQYFITSGLAQDDYSLFGPECCWEVTINGIKRYSAGDSNEPMTIVRIPQVLQGMSSQRTAELEEATISETALCTTSTSGGRFLVLSEQPEAPWLCYLQKLRIIIGFFCQLTSIMWTLLLSGHYCGEFLYR